MATITLTLSSADLTRAQDALAGWFSYPATVDGSPNPETKAQFAKRMVVEYVKGIVVSYETRVAQQAVAAPTPPAIT